MGENIYELIICDGEKRNGESDPSHAFWSLKDDQITVKNGDQPNIQLRDLVRVDRYDGDHLTVIAYPLLNGKRQRKSLKVFSRDIDNLHDHLRSAALKLQKIPHQPDDDAVNDRRYLIIINPFSGQQKAESLWKAEIQPLLDDAGILYDIQWTERSGHASEIIRGIDLCKYVGVAILSGDGLVSEVIHGLLTRKDRDRALRFPIAHIPCGTSNALAAAIAYQSNEPFEPRGVFCRQMALMCSRPTYRPLRLYHVETEADGHRPMFMSAVWGLIADIDLGSERFRWAGMIRLHIEAFIRISRLPQLARYRGRISFKPANDPRILRNTMVKAEKAREQLGEEHFQSGSILQYNSSEHSDLINENSVESAFENTHLEEFPSLSDPVPSDWSVIEGEFAFVCLSSMSHLGSDLPYTPSARLDEEVFYLSLVDWRTLKTRFHMAHLLITIDRCSHLDHECFQVIPVLGCRVEPLDNAGGYFAVDGEPCASGTSFQVLSTKLNATVIGRTNS